VVCCFNNLKQLFARGQELTDSFADISRYSDLSRVDATLGCGASRADTASLYEDVVEELEGNVERILDFCGLAFEPACVQFRKRNVLSLQQARAGFASQFSDLGFSSKRTTSPGSAHSRVVWVTR
jgi:hypothetical protein